MNTEPEKPKAFPCRMGPRKGTEHLRYEICEYCFSPPSACLGCVGAKNFRGTFAPRVPARWERWGIWIATASLVALAILTGKG